MKIWPWTRFDSMQAQIDLLKESLDHSRKCHSQAQEGYKEAVSALQDERKEHEKSRGHLRQMATIMALKAGIAGLFMLCLTCLGQPLLRNPLTTNAVPLAPADGWFLSWLTGKPVWSLNGGSLTNLHDGIWTNNTHFTWLAGQPAPDITGVAKGPQFFIAPSGIFYGTNVIQDSGNPINSVVTYVPYVVNFVDSNDLTRIDQVYLAANNENLNYYTEFKQIFDAGSPTPFQNSDWIAVGTNGFFSEIEWTLDSGNLSNNYFQFDTNGVNLFHIDQNGFVIANQFKVPSLFTTPTNSPVIGQVVTATSTVGDSKWANAPVGTVTSVGLSLPNIFTVSGSPVTGAGTLTGTLANENANSLFAGPPSGGATAPTFRTMVGADIPAGIVANSSLVNSSITLNGTANQITGPGSVSLGGSGTFSIPSPFIAPGQVSGTGITNTSFAAVGVVTNDANGKTYTTPTLPNSLLGNSSITIAGSANEINVVGGGPVSLGGTATLGFPKSPVLTNVTSYALGTTFGAALNGATGQDNTNMAYIANGSARFNGYGGIYSTNSGSGGGANTYIPMLVGGGSSGFQLATGGKNLIVSRADGNQIAVLDSTGCNFSSGVPLSVLSTFGVTGLSSLTNGVASYSSNQLAITSISVGASPFNWTNTIGRNVFVFVDGAGVSAAAAINGTTVYTAVTGGDYNLPLQPGEWATITYTVGAPVMKWKPF